LQSSTNICINQRLATASTRTATQQQQPAPSVYTPTNVAFGCYDAMLRDEAAFCKFDELEQEYENPWSNNRNRMAKEIEALKLTCPDGLCRRRTTN
jgi:hypothetical protein